MVILVPEPVEVTLPGERVKVHEPVRGNPLNETLPVARLQEGEIIEPTMGATGLPGFALITTFEEAIDIQPSRLVTVNV